MLTSRPPWWGRPSLCPCQLNASCWAPGRASSSASSTAPAAGRSAFRSSPAPETAAGSTPRASPRTPTKRNRATWRHGSPCSHCRVTSAAYRLSYLPEAPPELSIVPTPAAPGPPLSGLGTNKQNGRRMCLGPPQTPVDFARRCVSRTARPSTPGACSAPYLCARRAGTAGRALQYGLSRRRQP